VAGIGGRVQRTHVGEGAHVRAGDPLIQLDPRRLRLKKNAVESRIHLAELRTAGSRYELAGLYRELHQIQVDLGRYTIVSPVEGVIVWLVTLKPDDALFAGQTVALAIPRLAR
jgi:multidrug resistance efflux pump